MVDEDGSCRNPDLARPSMYGFCIDVSRRMASVGWVLNAPGPDGKSPSMRTVAGLVLLG